MLNIISTQLIPSLFIKPSVHSKNIYSVIILCHKHITRLSPCICGVSNPVEKVDIKQVITNTINMHKRDFHALIIDINELGLPFL